MVYEIEGKVALITGAASGIGFQYAKELLRHGLKHVAILDLDSVKGKEAEEQLNSEFGAKKAWFIQTDVTKNDQFEGAFKNVINSWKKLDIVINNAGVLNDGQWELTIDVNCKGLLRGSLLAIDHMSRHKGGQGGVVVNIASVVGLEPITSIPIYSATKHFVIGLQRGLADAFYNQVTGMRFLAMCPGVTDTELLRQARNKLLTQVPGVNDLLEVQLVEYPTQETDDVAKGMITIIREGEHGTIWISEGGEPVYKVLLPDRKELPKI